MLPFGLVVYSVVTVLVATTSSAPLSEPGVVEPESVVVLGVAAPLLDWRDIAWAAADEGRDVWFAALAML